MEKVKLLYNAVYNLLLSLTLCAIVVSAGLFWQAPFTRMAVVMGLFLGISFGTPICLPLTLWLYYKRKYELYYWVLAGLLHGLAAYTLFSSIEMPAIPGMPKDTPIVLIITNRNFCIMWTCLIAVPAMVLCRYMLKKTHDVPE